MKQVKCPFVLGANIIFNKIKSFLSLAQNRLFLWGTLMVLGYFLPWLILSMFGYEYGFSIFSIGFRDLKIFTSFKDVFGVDLKNYFLFLPILFFFGFIIVFNFWAKIKNFWQDKVFYLINIFVSLGSLLVGLAFYLKYKELLVQLKQAITGFSFFENFILDLGMGFYLTMLVSILLLFESLVIKLKK